ncbi:hypothetical protein LUX09_34570 [Streptomyces albogriseolus]|nr:hypothetical protein [Streptomyces albogriseolus]
MGAGGLSGGEIPSGGDQQHPLHHTKERLSFPQKLLCLKAHIATRAEREQRATMVAMAQSLPDGGAAARFEQGQSAWLFRKNAADPADRHRAITTREAA